MAYVFTAPLRKASKSSTDSGMGSGGAAGAGAGAGAGRGPGAGAGVDRACGVETEEVADAGEARVFCSAGTAWGSSMVDEAMSSRRAVAASNLTMTLANMIADRPVSVMGPPVMTKGRSMPKNTDDRVVAGGWVVYDG